MGHAFHYNQHEFREVPVKDDRCGVRDVHRSGDHRPKCRLVLSGGVLPEADGALAPCGAMVLRSDGLAPCGVLALRSDAQVQCGVLLLRNGGLDQHSGALALQSGVLDPHSEDLVQYSGILAQYNGALSPRSDAQVLSSGALVLSSDAPHVHKHCRKRLDDAPLALLDVLFLEAHNIAQLFHGSEPSPF